MMLTYGLTGIIVGAFIIKYIIKGTLPSGGMHRLMRPFDIPILIFLVSQILSTIFSIDKHVSLYGYYSRFHGGLASTISYISLYFVFTREFMHNKKFVFKAFNASLISSLLVSLYAILQRLGIDKEIWVQDVQNRVFSTLGQPNWLAAYLSVIILISLSLYIREKDWKKELYLIASLIFYIAIIFTKSRSGFLGLWIGLVILILFLSPNIKSYFTTFYKNKFLNLFFNKIVVILIAFFLLSFVYGTPFSFVEPYSFTGVKNKLVQKPVEKTEEVKPQGPALESGGTESGAIRKIVWQGAIDIFKNYPFFGSGVETFAFSYYQFRPIEHNLTSEWDFLYNKAHNEYLNFAATTGIIGLGSYLLIIIVFILKTFYDRLKGKMAETALSFGLLSAFLSILISNSFGFSVVVIGIFFFMIPAFYFCINNSLKPQNKKAQAYSKVTAAIGNFQIISTLIIIIAVLFLNYKLVILWQADTSFNSGYQLVRNGEYIQSYQYLKKAVEQNPNEPIFKEELATAESFISVESARQNEKELSQKLKDEALYLSSYLVEKYSKNVNFWKTRTRVLHTLAEISEPELENQSLDASLNAWNLAPTDVKIAYNVGLLYAKTKKKKKALETLIKATQLKPDYYEPRFALALFYDQVGEKEKAKEEFEYIIKNIRPDDPATKEQMEKLK